MTYEDVTLEILEITFSPCHNQT